MAIVLASSVVSLADYSALAASVSRWTHRTDLADAIPEFVLLAESRISRDLRIRKQIVSTVLSTTAGEQGILIPDDWLEFENLSVGVMPERQLTYVTIEQLDARFPKNGPAGVPFFYTIEGNQVLFGPMPNAIYPINILYFSRFDSLLTAQTNWLLTNHPSVYLFSVLMEAMLYTQNMEMLAVYTQRYQAEMAQLQVVDDRSTHSGSVLRVRTI